MILTRSPLRISYIGGGTDFPQFYETSFGCSIGAAINKYVYVASNPLSETSTEKIRFSYNQVESCNRISDIKHPVLRVVIDDFQNLLPLAVSTFSDIPARNGLGGSSSFTAALYKNFLEASNQPSTADRIAKYAVEVEREKLNEYGGHQDQYQTSFGGFNFYLFKKNEVKVEENLADSGFLDYLSRRQILVYSGFTRTQIPKSRGSVNDNRETLETIRDLTVSTHRVFKANTNDHELAFETLRKGVEEYWKLKSYMSFKESEFLFDEIRHLRQHNLDFTYKLLGAGGGGFFLILGTLETIELIKEIIPSNRWIQPGFSQSGTEIIYSE